MRVSREKGRKSWRLAHAIMLNNHLQDSSQAPSIESDNISPLSLVSSHVLFPTPGRHETTALMRENSSCSTVDAISPLEPNRPWTGTCWSDAATAGAVLSLLHKEPLDPASGEGEETRGTPRRTCSMCFEDFEPRRYPETPIAAGCDHTSISSTHICIICLSRSIDAQLSHSRATVLTCPLCHAELSDDEVERWASTPTFLAYDLARTRQFLQEDAEFVMCISPHCGYGQLHAGGLADPIVVCAACGMRTCFVHKRIPWHEGLTCAEYDATERSSIFHRQGASVPSAVLTNSDPRHGPLASEFLSMRTIQETTRACPGCYVATERAGGCKYMRCGLCWQEWCWDCGIHWERRHFGVECSISQ
ncbi:hypothetical protein BJX99DRAFT_7716 [Aspergillus californicus]